MGTHPVHDVFCAAISPRSRTGVILRRSSQLEFMGPGALIYGGIMGTIWDGTDLIGIGPLNLQRVSSLADQKEALRHHIQWHLWLERVQAIIPEEERIIFFLQSLEVFFGMAVPRSLPVEILGELLNCGASLVQWVRDYYFANWIQPWTDSENPLDQVHWQWFTPDQWRDLLHTTAAPPGQPVQITPTIATPCPAQDPGIPSSLPKVSPSNPGSSLVVRPNRSPMEMFPQSPSWSLTWVV